MEGVGARLGRSSTRYGGPATVFSGPVRKWKKKWVPLTNTTTTNNHSNNNNNNNSSSSPSNLVIYKWTPISKDDTTTTDSADAKKFRYVPIAVIEEQKQEAGAKSDDENKPEDGDPAQHPSQTSGSEGKPDENGLKQESQTFNKDGAPTEEANETSLDLNLGFRAHDGDSSTDQRMGEQEESNDQLGRTTSAGDVEMR